MPSEADNVTVYGLPLSAVEANVPDIRPVLLLMVNPDGSPVALYVKVSWSLSRAVNCNDTASLSALIGSPGLTKKTWLTVQEKVWLELCVPSEAVTWTE